MGGEHRDKQLLRDKRASRSQRSTKRSIATLYVFPLLLLENPASRAAKMDSVNRPVQIRVAFHEKFTAGVPARRVYRRAIFHAPKSIGLHF